MSGREYVVEFRSARDGALSFEVSEHARPGIVARFVVTIAELAAARDPATLMAARVAAALDQVRSR